MRLFVITAFYPPHHSGGYEMRCRDVVDGLQKRGHEMLVVTTRCQRKGCKLHLKEEQIYRVLHERTGVRNVISQVALDCEDLRLIESKLKDFQPDLIYLWHIQNLSNAIFPYFSQQDIPVVYDEGGSGLVYFSRILKRGLYFYKNESDAALKKLLKEGFYFLAGLMSNNMIRPRWSWPQNMYVYFNGASAVRYAENNGVPLKDQAIIHSGIRVADFPFKERLRFGSPLTIIVPGRIKPEKGTIDSLHLVAALAKKSIKAKLKIVGPIQSQKYFSEITHVAQTTGLAEAVEYLPMVSQADLARLYREADVCFFPSHFQSGFSRLPLEAMASGCLMITYGNEGSQEIVMNEKTGLVVFDGDVLSAADRIEDLFQHPGKYETILRNARLLVEDEYTLDKYVDSINAFLYQTLTLCLRDKKETDGISIPLKLGE